MKKTEFTMLNREMVFFIVDTSGSMTGLKIAVVNETMRHAISLLEEMNINKPYAQTKVAVLQFDCEVKWLYPKPIDAKNYEWKDLQANGLT